MHAPSVCPSVCQFDPLQFRPPGSTRRRDVLARLASSPVRLRCERKNTDAAPPPKDSPKRRAPPGAQRDEASEKAAQRRACTCIRCSRTRRDARARPRARALVGKARSLPLPGSGRDPAAPFMKRHARDMHVRVCQLVDFRGDELARVDIAVVHRDWPRAATKSCWRCQQWQMRQQQCGALLRGARHGGLAAPVSAPSEVAPVDGGRRRRGMRCDAGRVALPPQLAFRLRASVCRSGCGRQTRPRSLDSVKQSSGQTTGVSAGVDARLLVGKLCECGSRDVSQTARAHTC